MLCVPGVSVSEYILPDNQGNTNEFHFEIRLTSMFSHSAID